MISIDNIRKQCKIQSSSFHEERVIHTTPETLARVCDEIQHFTERTTGGSFNLETAMELNAILEIICKDYLSKMNIIMDIERLQSMTDIKEYDLYSCKFEYIQWAPPPSFPSKKSKCSLCRLIRTGKNKRKSDDVLCPYHLNQTFAYSKKNSSIVRTEDQFKHLPELLRQLATASTAGNAKIITYLSVPGLAENRPLISIGDLVRFRFGMEEVIGEVGEVKVKTEIIMLFLPIPYDMNTCPTYLEALMNPKNQSHTNRGINHIGRFDVRFGLFSTRAHDIFKKTGLDAVSHAMSQVTRVMVPTPFLNGIERKSLCRAQRHGEISRWGNNGLNAEQQNAVFDILHKNHGQAPYCIYGPPGTGKTMTVVESIFQTLCRNMHSKILVCAPSDAACDVIALRLLPILPPLTKVKRVNWWSRNPSSLPPALLPCSTMNESGFFVIPSQQDLQEASVIVCQCFVAGCLELGSKEEVPWMRDHFSHVFIDESSQSFEFESLIPLLNVGKHCSIVLAGDPRQLGPTVRSQCASRNGLSLSLQERLMGLSLYQVDTDYCVITKLLDNYRSHDALLQVPSELFYTGSLRCKASSIVTSTCANFELLRDGANFPMMVYDVPDGIEHNKIDTPSFYNIKECETVVKLIKSMLASPNIAVNAGEIAVITCFRAQVLKMREMLRKSDLGSINVGVVEDFQGQETSVVLISTVLTNNQERWRTGAKGGLGFMTDPKRFNVAITRASALVVIVGKVDYLENSGSYWTALIEHVKRNGGISNDSKFISNHDDDKNAYDAYDYGINEFIERVKELKLTLGSGHEMDRYDMVLRGHYQDAPEWKVCL